MTNQDIQTLAENALHEACRHIQDALGVTTGDTAGMFFTGDREEIILDILTRYIDTELMLKDFANATKDQIMTFKTFLIEFYPYPDCVHAEYDETSAESLEDAVAELKKYHPDAEILNTYIHTSSLEASK